MSRRIYRYCITCGKKIVTDPSHDKKYCSRECFFFNKKRRTGNKIVSNGYIMVKVEEDHVSPSVSKMGYEYEHRYVMEKYLGRYLTSGEYVHHYNDDTKDNRIENLYLNSNSKKVKFEEGIIKDLANGRYIRVPDTHRSPSVGKYGFELYHKYLMEKHIGRYLKKNEKVVFLNGDKSDVRIVNLKIVDKKEYFSFFMKKYQIKKAEKNRKKYGSGLSPKHRRKIQEAAKKRKGEKRKQFNHPGTYRYWKYFRYGKEVFPRLEAVKEGVTPNTIINRSRYQTMGYSRVEKNREYTLQMC